MYLISSTRQLSVNYLSDFFQEGFRQIKESEITTIFKDAICKMITSAGTILNDHKFTILGALLTCGVALSFFRLHADQPQPSHTHTTSKAHIIKPQESSRARMKLLHFLGEDQYILKFLSHPRVIQYFREQWKKIDEKNIEFKDLIEEVSREFPNDSWIHFQKKFYRSMALRINKPMPSQEIIFPFLYCGIGDFKFDAKIEPKVIQHFQVGLFKHYIARVVINSWDNDVERDLLAFCRSCPEPLFRDVIGPFLQQLDDDKTSPSDLFTGHENNTEEDFSPREMKILFKMFGSYTPTVNRERDDSDEESVDSEIAPPRRGVDSLTDLSSDSGSDSETLFLDRFSIAIEDYSETLAVELVEKIFEDSDFKDRLNEEESLGSKKLREFFENNSSIFFSKEEIIKLFFEVLIEEYPEEKDYFHKILNDGILRPRS